MKELTFGQHLTKFRVSRNLTKLALSQKVGVTAVYIGSIENGDKTPPKFKVVKKIQTALFLNEDESFLFFKRAFEERTLKEKQFLDELKKIKSTANQASSIFNRSEELMEKFGRIYNRARMNDKLCPKLSEIADILNDADNHDLSMALEIFKGIRKVNKDSPRQVNRNSKVNASI